MKSKRLYPRRVFVLQPSFKPVEVTIVKQYSSWGSEDYGDISEKGKPYPVNAMYASLAEAIADGRKQIENTRADIEKRTENMNKKIAQLNKAEGV